MQPPEHVTGKGVPMHPLERIIKAHTADGEISPGSLVTIDVDVAGVNDLYLQVLESFREMGGRYVWIPIRSSSSLTTTHRRQQ
jgi:3-isopropylmalate/(R)-2-methylmalate dehydratase large subunit